MYVKFEMSACVFVRPFNVMMTERDNTPTQWGLKLGNFIIG